MIVITFLYDNIIDTKKHLQYALYQKTVNEILLKSIKEITNFAKKDKQEFLKVMNKLSDEKREEKLEKLSSINVELTTLIIKLYEAIHLEKFP